MRASPNSQNMEIDRFKMGVPPPPFNRHLGVFRDQSIFGLVPCTDREKSTNKT